MKHRPLLLIVPLIAVFLFLMAGAANAVGVVKVSNASPTPGTAITVTSTGWSAGQRVTVAIGQAQDTLARVAANADGAVHARVTIPADVTLDINVLSVTGTSSTGIPQVIVTPLSVHRLGKAPAPTRPWGVDPRARGNRRCAIDRQRAVGEAGHPSAAQADRALAERRPGGAAQQPALPIVTHFQRVVHPGAGALHVGGKLAGEQRREPFREVDPLPKHDLASTRRTERGLEHPEQREQRPCGSLFQARRVVRARLVEVLIE